MHKLPLEFYTRDDVNHIALELIGMTLYSAIGGQICGGIITETEAYAGTSDRASHAYGGRYTGRNRIMYEHGGIAYIYFCYGIHSLFNVVTNITGIPDAVLIRAVFPVQGIDAMASRLGKMEPPEKMGSGPGKLSRAMGLHYSMSGISLLDDQVWISEADHGLCLPPVQTGPRIGVAYAGEDALLPYRYYIPGNKPIG